MPYRLGTLCFCCLFKENDERRKYEQDRIPVNAFFLLSLLSHIATHPFSYSYPDAFVFHIGLLVSSLPLCPFSFFLSLSLSLSSPPCPFHFSKLFSLSNSHKIKFACSFLSVTFAKAQLLFWSCVIKYFFKNIYLCLLQRQHMIGIVMLGGGEQA